MAEKFVPSKVCLSWVSKRGIWMSRDFCRDVPDPWGCSESLCKKSLCAFFVPTDEAPENQASQHMPNQPRVSSPDLAPRLGVHALRCRKGHLLAKTMVVVMWRELKGQMLFLGHSGQRRRALAF